MNKIEHIRKHYVHRITPDRKNYDVLDWAGPDTQIARFEVLIQNVDLAGLSLLDVGCGLGDLAGFLRRRNLPVHYTGVDVIEEMLARARQEHPQERFVCADVFTDSDSFVSATGDNPLQGETFDVVFCSGTLNLNLGNNLEFLPFALRQMKRYAQKYLAVNFLRARDPFHDPVYFYYRPTDVQAALDTIAGIRRVEIIDNYLPNDFTALCSLGDS